MTSHDLPRPSTTFHALSELSDTPAGLLGERAFERVSPRRSPAHSHSQVALLSQVGLLRKRASSESGVRASKSADAGATPVAQQALAIIAERGGVSVFLR